MAATTITLVLARMLALPQGYWAVITAILVVQASIGGSLSLARDRLIATLAGAAGGALALALLGHSQTGLAVALVSSSGALAYFAARRPALRLAPVTAAIIVLSDTQHTTPLFSAADRVAEILIGTVVALGVSLVLFPSRASGSLIGMAGRLLPTFATHLGRTLSAALSDGWDTAAFMALNAEVRGAFGTAETLLKEARLETAGRLTSPGDPAALVRSMRRLWYTLMSAARATRKPLPATAALHLKPALEAIAGSVPAVLEAIARRPAGPLAEADALAIIRAMAALDGAMANLRQSGVMRDMPTEDVAQVFSLTYALGQLGENVRDVANRLSELSGGGPVR